MTGVSPARNRFVSQRLGFLGLGSCHHPFHSILYHPSLHLRCLSSLLAYFIIFPAAFGQIAWL